jgi:protein-S-isoprenylcysteine O-methyltransferase Ste14
MPAYGYAVLAAAWVIWCTPFVRARQHSEPAKVLDRRARWGIALVGIAYSILWQNKFWERSLPAWRLAISILFFLFACLLSWTAVRTLGRQWRLDAGLSSDHRLVTTGPYRFVRHPIYASIFSLLLGTGFLISPFPLLALAAVVCIAGIEIRVRIEESLLESRFGESFLEYRRNAPAYIPFLR